MDKLSSGREAEESSAGQMMNKDILAPFILGFPPCIDGEHLMSEGHGPVLVNQGKHDQGPYSQARGELIRAGCIPGDCLTLHLIRESVVREEDAGDDNLGFRDHKAVSCVAVLGKSCDMLEREEGREVVSDVAGPPGFGPSSRAKHQTVRARGALGLPEERQCRVEGSGAVVRRDRDVGPREAKTLGKQSRAFCDGRGQERHQILLLCRLHEDGRVDVALIQHARKGKQVAKGIGEGLEVEVGPSVSGADHSPGVAELGRRHSALLGEKRRRCCQDSHDGGLDLMLRFVLKGSCAGKADRDVGVHVAR